MTGITCGDETVRADLVVDASGRGSRSPQWLAALGYRPPLEERIGIELRYTTRVFGRDPAAPSDCNAVVVVPAAHDKRGAAMVKQENDRWIVTLVTHFGDYPPPDLAAFREFTRSLPIPDIYNVVSAAEPLGEPQMFRVPASVRRRYERLRRFPAGYLVVGDAISSFNPLYGQGMSVAALKAMQLAALARRRRGFTPQRFFRHAARVVDAPWQTSTLNDLRMPETTGRRGPAVRALNWYVARVLRASHDDSRPWHAFLRVSNLLAPPVSLMRPDVVLDVIRASRRRRA